MADSVQYRALLAVDIERSAGRGNVALREIRAVLAEALRAAVARSGIDWAACLHDDLGDGLRVVAPTGLPKAALVHPLVPELAARLRAHNRRAAPRTAVRVRAALHAGEVDVPDGHGQGATVTGGPLEVLARLLDAPVLKGALADAPDSVSLALLMSRHFYEETVPHGYPGIDPGDFHQVTCAAKEYTAEAWLHLAPDSAAAGRPPHRSPEAGPEAAGGPESGGGAVPSGGHEPAGGQPGGHSTMVNTATGNGAVYATQHGTLHVHGPGGR
ncbi:hypothetical protein LG943_05810 [Streptomonospora sp. S1-112]|uniref:Uncharacterized protein n=1 Tax=Streptomonospora mangrovi TaxID=2883123 RepID=A0A9X3NL52_9ACTN|nr:hypothetical protein [Streptomonospora mangrovi]MDA0563844.1 hypothetical protein [Streptomonospora mangrovi]